MEFVLLPCFGIPMELGSWGTGLPFLLASGARNMLGPLSSLVLSTKSALSFAVSPATAFLTFTGVFQISHFSNCYDKGLMMSALVGRH